MVSFNKRLLLQLPKIRALCLLVFMNRRIFFIVLVIFCLPANAIEVQRTFYDSSHIHVVESGFEEMKKQFFEGSNEQKNSLLFCLERYVDPYYTSTIDYEKELFDWLLLVIEGDEVLVVKENALDLLSWDSRRDNIECEIYSTGKLICAELKQ